MHLEEQRKSRRENEGLKRKRGPAGAAVLNGMAGPKSLKAYSPAEYGE
jgi:hypothetical protein